MASVGQIIARLAKEDPAYRNYMPGVSTSDTTVLAPVKPKAERKPVEKPNRKVSSGGVAGALTVILVWALGELNVSVPPEVASALTLLLAVGVAYIVPLPSEDV